MNIKWTLVAVPKSEKKENLLICSSIYCHVALSIDFYLLFNSEKCSLENEQYLL